MKSVQVPANAGDSLRDVVGYYRCYLGRNRDLAKHCARFLKREKTDPKAAQAEAVIFSWLRAEKLEPHLFENVGTGGPDFCCTHSDGGHFLVEATSLDSERVSNRSGLPTEITSSGGMAFGLITDKLKAKAKSKARQLAGHSLPTVLAIASDHVAASILMDRQAAEYLMTSAPLFAVPLNGDPGYWTLNLKDAVFRRPTGLFDVSGQPIIGTYLQSISAILLITVDDCTDRIVGALHPDATNPFNPQWMPGVPFIKFAETSSPTQIATKWIQSDEICSQAHFPHRHIR